MPIHAVLANAFSKYTSRTDRTPGVVDAGESDDLIDKAMEINSQSRGCCGTSSKKGDKGLKELIQTHPDKFKAEGLANIQYYLKHHQLRAGSNGHGSSNPSIPSNPSRPNRPEPSTPVAPTTPSDTTSPYGKVILEWKCEKSTWHAHWWPMKASQPGGDPINNLYAPGGPLEKYDAAFKRNSKSVELAKNAKPHNSDAKYNWWGHCNNASQIACLLQEPIKDVEYNGVLFTAHDIGGLLCKVVPSLSKGEDFRGNRYNGPTDDPNDPNPVAFLNDVLKAWGGKKEGKPVPFILDIDRTEMVWNYPFDQGKVFESEKAPAGIDTRMIPTDGKIKYYRSELKGTGFKQQERNYQFWIKYDGAGKPADSGWIAGEDEKINPDFAWRPHPVGDLNDSRYWVTNESAQNNSEVRAEDVYKLYKASIA